MKLLRRLLSRKAAVVASKFKSEESLPETAPVAGSASKDDQQDAHLVVEAKNFFNSIATGDVEGLKKSCHENCAMYFPDNVEMLAGDMAEEVTKVAKAFPDAHFNYSEATLVEPNVVLLKFRWTGTHTGQPYAFGPYEPIPAKGTHVAMDPERVTLTFQDGLILKCRVVPEGPNTGWHGVYQAIGGLII